MTTIFHQTSERLPVGHNYAFKFEEALPESWQGKIVSFPFEVASQLYRLAFKVDDSKLTTSTPAVGKALLAGHRHDPEHGLFLVDRPLLLNLVKGVCSPEELSPDDLIFTCHEAQSNKYRRALLSLMKPKNLEKHQAEIRECIEETVGKLVGKNGQLVVDTSELSLQFSTAMVSKLLLCHPGPYEAIGQAGSAAINGPKVSTFSLNSESEATRSVADFPTELGTVDRKRAAVDYLQARVQAVSKQLEQYEQLGCKKWNEEIHTSSVEVLRKAVETSFNSSETPLLGPLVQKLREKPEFGEEQLSDQQIKSLILSLYIAGSETTSFVLSCLLYQLAHHPEYQDAILREANGQESSPTANRLFAESMRLFTPVSEIVRVAARDLFCVAEDEQHNEVYRKRIPKGTAVIYNPALAGESLHPGFDLTRPSLSPDDLSWLPFGYGKHTCPGQALARAEILGFVTTLVQKYKILPITKELPKLEEGATTRKLASCIFIRLDKRNS